MNIMIDEWEFNKIIENRKEVFRTVVGSRLYTTNKETSDTDILIITKTPEYEWLSGLPNNHQFQYKANNTDFLITSEAQFNRNLYSGDSTINVDVLLFTDYGKRFSKGLIHYLTTYNIIKGFLGFAKRDLTEYKKGNKLFHAARSIYCAERLLNLRLPRLEHIIDISKTKQDPKQLKLKCEELRKYLNELYDRGSILRYPKISNMYSFARKQLEANNLKEFKYI